MAVPTSFSFCTSVDIKQRGNIELHVVNSGCDQTLEENIRKYVRHLECLGRYDTIIEATPMGLLGELMDDEDVPITPAMEDYVIKCVAKENVGICSQWGGVILPFLNTALAYVLQNKMVAHNAMSGVMDTKIAVVSASPYTPSCEFSANSREALLRMIEECSTYSRANFTSRGGDCGRWGTRLIPEGFSHVLSIVSGPGWRACELPSRGSKCAMVVLPDVPVIQMFRLGNGFRFGGGLRLVRTGIAKGVSLFECIFDQIANRITIYDCATADGKNVRHVCLSLRIKAAEETVKGWLVGSEDDESEPVIVAKYTPPISVVDKISAERVLFVNDAAPLGFFPGGDAYAWKEPSLKEGMYVLTCRSGECMAVACRGDCLLRKVGNLVNPESTKHMGTYVCELVSPSSSSRENLWKAIRPAKSSERLFTFDECYAAEYPRTQITRGGMMKLLDQISPSMIGSSSKASAQRQFKPRPITDRDKRAPSETRSSHPLKSKSKQTESSESASVPETKNAFWALQDGSDDGWCIVAAKKK